MMVYVGMCGFGSKGNIQGWGRMRSRILKPFSRGKKFAEESKPICLNGLKRVCLFAGATEAKFSWRGPRGSAAFLWQTLFPKGP